MTLQPVRASASRQYAGPSLPWSWSRDSEHRSATRATSSRGASTNTPASSTRRRSSEPRASASSRSHRLPLPGQKIMPSAQAPSSTDRRASPASVIPQILTAVMPQMVARRPEPAAACLGDQGVLVLLAGRLGPGRPVAESDLGALLRAAAVVLDGHLVAGLLAVQRREHVLRLLDLLAVHSDDDVAADRQAIAGLRGAGAKPRLVCRSALGDVLDKGAARGREVEILSE